MAVEPSLFLLLECRVLVKLLYPFTDRCSHGIMTWCPITHERALLLACVSNCRKGKQISIWNTSVDVFRFFRWNVDQCMLPVL